MKKYILLILIFSFCLFPTISSALPTANFTYNIRGANIICTQTCTEQSSIDEFKWTATINGSEIGTTGWINDTITDYTITLPHGGQLAIQLCIKNGTYTDCKEINTGKVSKNRDKYPPGQYKSRKLCEDVGYYWYNGSCHKKDKTLPWNVEKPLEAKAGEHLEYQIEIYGFNFDIRIILLILGLIAMIIFIKKGGKKR